MGKLRTVFGLLILLPVVIACQPNKPEFALPDGDADIGRDLFVSIGCNSCHTVNGVELPAPEAAGPVTIQLGGSVSKLKSYPELVTSVINPSHEIVRHRRPEDVSQDGESLMTVYNDVMTVSELIHLVTFLESNYREIERPKIRYRSYSY